MGDLDASKRVGTYEVSLRDVRRTHAKTLGAYGLDVPVQAMVASELTVGLEALPRTDSRSDQGVTLPHLANMVWQPVLRHMEGSGPWSPQVAKNHQALAMEMEGLASNPAEP
jgi:hypothetical protein